MKHLIDYTNYFTFLFSIQIIFIYFHLFSFLTFTLKRSVCGSFSHSITIHLRF